jgi:cytosine/adenosine deaminase-related metal-dependent hydrolase
MALTAPGPLSIGPDRSGRSVALDGGLVVATAPPQGARLPCAEGEITPGAVCAHTHLYSGLARYGMPPAAPPPDNFLQILERVWWKLDRALDADILHAAAMDYVARALLAGTTTLVDHHESPGMIEGSLEILANACHALGVRALLCYGATERNFGVEEGRRGVAECRRVPSSPLVRGLVGLHASFTVSDDTILAAGRLAQELGTIVHVHVAEDAADVADAAGRGYRGPLERLEQLGALPRGSILAHGVHLDGEQARRCDELGCWLVHNPRSNEGNRVGYALNLGRSLRVALGCDGWDADMAAEEDALSRLAAIHGDTSTGGRLRRGHALVAERFAAHPEPLQAGALGDVVVRAQGAVKQVIVGGRVVVADGRLVTGDFEAIVANAREQADRLWKRMADL